MIDTCDHDKSASQDHSHEGHAHEVDGHETNSHSCSHHHVDVKDTSGSRMLITLALNFIIPVVQIVGGFYAHSMALISDATHNFSDFTAIFISYVAFRIGKKSASVQNTFGYRRAEIMAALINVVILAGASAFIIYGAVHRLHHPETVSGLIVVYVAGIGILGNGISAWLLHRDSKHNLNVRSAFLHMMGDFLFSVAVLLNGVVLIFKPWYWLDPSLSLLIVLFILKNCWSILKESTTVLMNATPKNLDLQKIQNYLTDIPEVLNVHYLHAWNVSSSSVAFSCHVVLPDQALSRTEKLADKIRHDLMHFFHIDHPILQFETNECGNGSLLCELSCNDKH
jgi:cobalt-zinc-cadmium efflux system protein